MFALSGFFLQPIQPWTGFALAAVTAVLAMRPPKSDGARLSGPATGRLTRISVSVQGENIVIP